MKITKEKWGITAKNEEVYLYRLENEFLEVEVLNYGGIIRKIITCDKNNNCENIVLNLESIKDYEGRSPYFGAIVGRNAGRIKNGYLKIDGNEYKLSKNSGENNIHGGIDNFSHKIWKVKEINEKNRFGLELSLKSFDLEEGFPGNVEVKVEYLLEKNEFLLNYYATTDKPTYINLTNHSYFNLSGNFKRDILDEELILNCRQFIAVDNDTLPVEILNVEKSAFDFTKPKKLKEALYADESQIKIVGGGLDHPFIIDKTRDIPCAILKDRENGRVLEVYTDQEAVIIYSGNYLYEVGNLNKEIICQKHMGICFETQNYADALNFIPDRAIITTPENPYIQKTKYVFKIEK